MKLNWGTGIVIAFITFITFILYFVVNMTTNKKYNHDLVTEEYYKAELEYQQDIDKQNNSKSLSKNITYKKTNEGLVVYFPEDLQPEKITGKLFLYRPSNKQLDFETTLSLSKSHLLIPDNRLVDGRWDIKIDWQYNGTSYLFKDNLTY
ncbi:FixH family protein [Pontimicrobium aquaticum]|uniref:Cytochrome C oxidase Cbb3 n=1 Tax=Pontimicrobium aquaticum TaxID=2565367 RepID=A0A4U0EW69_9FLAO|nr:FixH family protein [Pontimicrobium aquaticum]TJY36187.1 cytochrome C oxidase Cbb3 [Pontimicrobium aquaticum]